MILKQGIVTMPSDFEKFQQQIFDQLDELEGLDKQRVVDEFIRLGHQCGVDVIAEIVDKKRSASDVFAELHKKQAKLPSQ
jgi:hypothetical protein